MKNRNATRHNFQDLGQLILVSVGLSFSKMLQFMFGPSIKRTNIFFIAKLAVELSNSATMLFALAPLKK